MLVVCEHGNKVSGTTKLLSPSDTIIGGNSYEVKIRFTSDLPNDLVGRICDAYKDEVCKTIEVFHMRYASVSPILIILNIDVLNGAVEYMTVEYLSDLFRRDLIFEDHEVLSVEISKIEIQQVSIFPIFLLMIVALILIFGLGKKK